MTRRGVERSDIRSLRARGEWRASRDGRRYGVQAEGSCFTLATAAVAQYCRCVSRSPSPTSLSFCIPQSPMHSRKRCSIAPPSRPAVPTRSVPRKSEMKRTVLVCALIVAIAEILTVSATDSARPLSSFPLAQQAIRQQYLTPAYLTTPSLQYPTTSHRLDCPCANATLCDPVTVPDRPELFIFQVSTDDWQYYNFTQLTTIVACAGVDPALLCYAHERDIRVVSIASYPVDQMGNETARQQWVEQQVAGVQASYIDGVNIDFEDALDATVAPLYTALVANLTSALHSLVPGSQVTVDVAWSPNCIDGRCYDAAGLAAASDFLFVMSYDLRSQIYNMTDCVASANSPIHRVAAGLHNYTALAGVAGSKLVLGVPWYFYDYPCINGTQPTDSRCEIDAVPFRGAPCSDAAGRERNFAEYGDLLAISPTGRHWSAQYASWWFNYVHPDDGVVHQVWMDDVVSLRVKYRLVERHELRGVGMWAADFLNYTEPVVEETRHMWAAIGEAAARGVSGGSGDVRGAERGVEAVTEWVATVSEE